MSQIKISLEDRMRAENLQLQMENIQKDLQLIQLQVQGKVSQRDLLLQKMNALRDEFKQKYDIDLASVKIEDDGSVTASPTPAPGTLPSK